MRQRDRERIGRVVGRGGLREVEQLRDPLRELLLVGAAEPRDRPLHGGGRVLENRQPCPGSAEKDDTAPLPHGKRRCEILSDEGRFEGDDLGALAIEHLREGVVDRKQPLPHRRPHRRADHVTSKESSAPRCVVEEAEPHHARPRIDAKHTDRRRVSGGSHGPPK